MRLFTSSFIVLSAVLFRLGAAAYNPGDPEQEAPSPLLKSKISSARSRIQQTLHRALTQHYSQLSSSGSMVLSVAHRALQDDEDVDTCSPNGTSVNFDDDVSLVVYSDMYKPECMCTETETLSELDTVADSFGIGVNGTVDDFVALFNELLSQSKVTWDYMCTNGCEACFGDNDSTVCGILSTEDSMSMNVQSGQEFSFDQLVAIGSGTLDFEQEVTVKGNYRFEECITYTSGLTGTVCYGGSVQNITSTLADFDSTVYENLECFGSYNGVACTSCELTLPGTDDEDQCIIANCTNVEDGAMIDSCAGTGLDGVFRIVEALDEAPEKFSVGSCDVQAPTMAPNKVDNEPDMLTPPAPMPTKAPTTSGIMETSAWCVLSGAGMLGVAILMM